MASDEVRHPTAVECGRGPGLVGSPQEVGSCSALRGRLLMKRSGTWIQSGTSASALSVFGLRNFWMHNTLVLWLMAKLLRVQGGVIQECFNLIFCSFAAPHLILGKVDGLSSKSYMGCLHLYAPYIHTIYTSCLPLPPSGSVYFAKNF